MTYRITSRLNALFALSTVVLTFGCASGKTAVEEDGSGGGETYTDRVRSEGIAGAAAQNVGWEDTIEGKEADDQPFSFTEQLLHGQVAGVEVIEYPGGGFAVRIRGYNSIMGGSDPLYIVDGMPVLHHSPRGLDWLNTRDIKKIEIVKDIDARALYGSRGANGVVLITTKLGPQKDDDKERDL